MGEVELKLWKYYDAVESFKNALKYARPYEFPKKGVLYSLGTAYIKIKKYEEAIDTFEKILEEDPKHADSLVNMAFTYEMLKDYQKEVECCKKVLELNPKDADALYNMAGAYMYLKNYSEAITWLEKLVNIKPDDYMAWNNLSVSYKKLGNADKAEYCKKKLFDLKGKKFEIVDDIVVMQEVNESNEEQVMQALANEFGIAYTPKKKELGKKGTQKSRNKQVINQNKTPNGQDTHRRKSKHAYKNRVKWK